VVGSGGCGCRAPRQKKKEKKKRNLTCLLFLVSVSGAVCADMVGEVAGAAMGGLNKR
jgi:hypothetical protein